MSHHNNPLTFVVQLFILQTMSNDNQKKHLSFDDLPELLTIEEVSVVLRVSKITLKRWGKKGKLPFIRINSRGDRRYKKEAVLWLLGIEPKE